MHCFFPVRDCGRPTPLNASRPFSASRLSAAIRPWPGTPCGLQAVVISVERIWAVAAHVSGLNFSRSFWQNQTGTPPAGLCGKRSMSATYRVFPDGAARRLLDEPNAKIGIDQAALGAIDGIRQSIVTYAFRLHKARDASRQENPHTKPTLSSIIYCARQFTRVSGSACTKDGTRPMPMRQFKPCNAGAMHRRH